MRSKNSARSFAIFLLQCIGLKNFVRSIYRSVTYDRTELKELKERVQFLYYENSDIRAALRHLLAEKLETLPQFAAETYDSFDYQWGHLTEGNWLLTDPKFKSKIGSTVSEYAGKPKEWFKGKKVLDAGCGNGRFSYGLASLGAHVTSVDLSAAGLASAKKSIGEHPDLPGDVQFHQRNLLEPLGMDGQFDFVWSFGVLHHTGDTYKAFKNVIKTLKPGGEIFLMLYGEPDWDDNEQFQELNTYWYWRRRFRYLKPVDRVHELEEAYKDRPQIVHGMFDAVSPPINDLYTLGEIYMWLVNAGFDNIRRTVTSRNLFVSATLKK